MLSQPRKSAEPPGRFSKDRCPRGGSITLKQHAVVQKIHMAADVPILSLTASYIISASHEALMLSQPRKSAERRSVFQQRVTTRGGFIRLHTAYRRTKDSHGCRCPNPLFDCKLQYIISASHEALMLSQPRKSAECRSVFQQRATTSHGGSRRLYTSDRRTKDSYAHGCWYPNTQFDCETKSIQHPMKR